MTKIEAPLCSMLFIFPLCVLLFKRFFDYYTHTYRFFSSIVNVLFIDSNAPLCVCVFLFFCVYLYSFDKFLIDSTVCAFILKLFFGSQRHAQSMKNKKK